MTELYPPRPLATKIAKMINEYVHQDLLRHHGIHYYPGYSQLDCRIELVLREVICPDCPGGGWYDSGHPDQPLRCDTCNPEKP